jgi:excisionase family DNA binding protein
MSVKHRSELLGPGRNWLFDLWTVEEVARALRVSKQTVYRWIHQGDLGHFQLASGGIRLAGLHVQAFLESGGTSEVEAEHVLLAASQPVEDDE